MTYLISQFFENKQISKKKYRPNKQYLSKIKEHNKENGILKSITVLLYLSLEGIFLKMEVSKEAVLHGVHKTQFNFHITYIQKKLKKNVYFLVFF